MDVELREATAADLPSFKEAFERVAAEGRWIGTEAPVDWSVREPRVAASIADPATYWLVAADGARVVGWASGEHGPHGRVELFMGLVDGYRSRGIGTKLLAAVIGWARHRGAHKLYLEVWPTNERAVGLYEKFGFVVEGRFRRHYRRGDGALWDALAMGLVLDEEFPGGP